MFVTYFYVLHVLTRTAWSRDIIPQWDLPGKINKSILHDTSPLSRLNSFADIAFLQRSVEWDKLRQLPALVRTCCCGRVTEWQLLYKSMDRTPNTTWLLRGRLQEAVKMSSRVSHVSLLLRSTVRNSTDAKTVIDLCQIMGSGLTVGQKMGKWGQFKKVQF